jgi:uncharacterized protein (TIGR03000 family)
MARQWLLKAGVPAMTLAALLWAGGAALAQRGGGHGGGGHGGGGHGGGGGGHAASFHGGGGHAGSYHGGGYRYGGAPYGYRGYGYRGYGYGYGRYGDYYHHHNHFYYPFFFGLGYYPFGYYGFSYPYDYGYGNGYSYPYDYYRPYYYPYDYGYGYSYDPRYNGNAYGPLDYSFSMPDYAGRPATDNSAHITVIVPANAELWFEGQKTSERGTVREFVSPSLTPGKTYAYEIRARWTENGREVSQVREADVRAGAQATVVFRPSASSRQSDVMPRASD